MFNWPDINNYLGSSCSFIHDFYLNIVALKLMMNNKAHGSEYNVEILEDSLKEEYHFDFPKNTRTVVRNMMNAATKVDDYFSVDSETFNCAMHLPNSAMKYRFGMLENKK